MADVSVLLVIIDFSSKVNALSFIQSRTPDESAAYSMNNDQ